MDIAKYIKIKLKEYMVTKGEDKGQQVQMVHLISTSQTWMYCFQLQIRAQDR